MPNKDKIQKHFDYEICTESKYSLFSLVIKATF